MAVIRDEVKHPAVIGGGEANQGRQVADLATIANLDRSDLSDESDESDGSDGHNGGRDGSRPYGEGADISDKSDDSDKSDEGKYEMLFREFGPKAKTQEEIDAEDRKAKRQKNFAAISDGIAALSNLYFTTQYAPNSYDPRQSMSDKTRQRWDKIIAERDGKQREYYQGLLRAKQMDEAAKSRDIADKLAQINLNFTQNKAAEHEKLAPVREREAQAKAEAAGYDRDIKKVAADGAPRMQELKEDTEGARKRSYDAQAASNYAKANHYKNGGASGKTVHHFMGKEYVSEKDYTKDVVDAAKAYNERHKGEAGFVPIETEYYEDNGYQSKHRIFLKPEEYAREVERRIESEKRGKGYGNDNGKGKGY